MLYGSRGPGRNLVEELEVVIELECVIRIALVSPSLCGVYWNSLDLIGPVRTNKCVKWLVALVNGFIF